MNNISKNKTSIQVIKETLEKINAVKLVLKKLSLSNEKLILLALDTLIEKFNDEQKNIYKYITYNDNDTE